MSKMFVFFFIIAANAGLTQTAQAKLHYLLKRDIPTKTVVSPPPLSDSVEDKKDMATILGLQKTRTAKECERAASEVVITLNSFFGPAYGPLDEVEVKRWSAFFERVKLDADFFIQRVKKKWTRPRPYVENSDVQPCVAKEVTKAYPSGHTAISRVYARVLSELDPARKQKFMARADEIAQDRVLSGLHHPTDIESGKVLGDRIFEKFMRKAAFRKDLDVLRILK